VTDNDKVLQTAGSIMAGGKDDIDDTSNSHGTMVASKAVGKKYGLAKEVSSP
jgi:hypothetical protein